MKNQSVNHELATGKSPEPAADDRRHKNACPTAEGATQLLSQSTSIAGDGKALSADDRRQLRSASAVQNASGGRESRAKLVEMFEDYGLRVAGFDGLRSDAYEKQVAAVAVDDLERVYEALLDPALGFAAARERCPVWPEGSRQAGKLPSMMTLREIKERLLFEWSVRDGMKDGDFMKRLEEAGPSDDQYLDGAVRLLGQELFRAKLDGTPISENLRVFDRLLKVKLFRFKQRQQAGLEMRKAGRHEAEINHKGTETQKTKVAPPEVKVDEKPSQKVEVKGLARPAREPMIGSNARPTMAGGHHKANVRVDENRKLENGLILTTGYEPLNWLPSLQKKDSLVDLIMAVGGPS